MATVTLVNFPALNLTMGRIAAGRANETVWSMELEKCFTALFLGAILLEKYV